MLPWEVCGMLPWEVCGMLPWEACGMLPWKSLRKVCLYKSAEHFAESPAL